MNILGIIYCFQFPKIVENFQKYFSQLLCSSDFQIIFARGSGIGSRNEKIVLSVPTGSLP
jgi:hypothetical protein